MRHLIGHGTPKQWLAAVSGPIFGLLMRISRLIARLGDLILLDRSIGRTPLTSRTSFAVGRPASPFVRFSTGC